MDDPKSQTKAQDLFQIVGKSRDITDRNAVIQDFFLFCHNNNEKFNFITMTSD